MHLPPPIIAKPLPYEHLLAQRKPTDIDLVVIHCTELPDLATAREYGERALYDNGSGNSGHYYIDRDGTVSRYVPDERIAHHGGADAGAGRGVGADQRGPRLERRTDPGRRGDRLGRRAQGAAAAGR